MAPQPAAGVGPLIHSVALALVSLLLTADVGRALVPEGFLCAGQAADRVGSAPPAMAAAKTVQAHTTGTRKALVLFARFRGEAQTQVPPWATDLLNPDRPGSLSHFYDTMSFGKLQVRGQVAPRVYESAHEAGFFLAADDTTNGRYDQFAREILEQADQDIDFAQSDNDGPDDIPNSGDDDGVVDAVFIVLDRVPAGFLRGSATGIGLLGFAEDSATQDPGVSGQPIRISPSQGTVQQGRSFAEAVGAMGHEYGHVLGLVDLYNTQYLGTPGAPPEEDSAGVGAWDLMGWGSLGWNGDDGPNSLSAWSRARLGWTEVEEVTQAEQEIRLEPVGSGGRIARIPLTWREYYLVEYRTRSGTYYDRNIPGEGLLVWHVERRLPTSGNPTQYSVDLECADGRWLDAGYPLGRQPDPVHGRDNLDFWAHDPGYAQAHGGNLGDATDLFDGVRYRSFTPETNPDSYSLDRLRSVRVEEIRLAPEAATARVRATPLVLEVATLHLQGDEDDGVLVSGEEVRVLFDLRNNGGLSATGLRVELTSLDSLVQVLQPSTAFQDLSPGQQSRGTGARQFLRICFGKGFFGQHTAPLLLAVYAGDQLVGLKEFEATGWSLEQVLQATSVIDTLGNQDGRVQAGEFIRLELHLDPRAARVLHLLRCNLRSLDPQVRLLGDPSVLFDGSRNPGRSLRSPEFLISGAVVPGARLHFALTLENRQATWQDTLQAEVEVAPGSDQTPPRLWGPTTHYLVPDLAIVLPAERVIDGSPIRAVAALVHRLDGTWVATVPLALQDGRYEGVWTSPAPGKYRVSSTADDAAGNRSRSQPVRIDVPPSFAVDGVPGPGPGTWHRLAPDDSLQYPGVLDLAVAPGHPEVVYALTRCSLLRSVDGGQSWHQTGYMNGFARTYSDHVGILVDGLDPDRAYVYRGRYFLSLKGGLSSFYRTEMHRSMDAGQTWIRVPLPEQGIDVQVLAVGLTGSGQLFAASGDRLIASSDHGTSWRQTGVEFTGYGPPFVLVHPAAPWVVYAGEKTEVLWRSQDSGATWVSQPLGRFFPSLALDPQAPDFLYATSTDTLWHSQDAGRTWVPVGFLKGDNCGGIVVHPSWPGLLFANPSPYASAAFVRWSEDGGRTWQGRTLLDAASHLYAVQKIVPVPGDPRRVFAVSSMLPGENRLAGESGGLLPLFISTDTGQSWLEVPMPAAALPVETVLFAPDGRLLAGSLRQRGRYSWTPGFSQSADGGFTWQWQNPDIDPLLEATLANPIRSSAFDPVGRLAVDPTRPEVVFAGLGLESSVWRSDDAGRNWARVSAGNDALYTSAGPLQVGPTLVADPQHAGVYYAAGRGGVYRSADFGVTWDQRGEGLPEPDLLTGYQPGDLVLAPGDPSNLYLAIDDRVWRSQDEGRTWADSGTIAAGQTILCLALHTLAPSRLYAATTNGVYVSEDRGNTWVLLRAADVGMWTRSRIRFAPGDAQVLYLANGHQLLESRDAGHTWRSAADVMAGHPWVSDVAVDPFEPRLLFAATPWGVYRLDTRQVDTAIEQAGPDLPRAFALGQNYPNPCNPQTTIAYQLPQAGRVRLTLYNVAGQVVRRLVDQAQMAGRYQVAWDSRDDQGREVGSGVYLYCLEAGPFRQTRRLVLLK